jgi:hypothetical protein
VRGGHWAPVRRRRRERVRRGNRRRGQRGRRRVGELGVERFRQQWLGRYRPGRRLFFRDRRFLRLRLRHSEPRRERSAEPCRGRSAVRGRSAIRGRSAEGFQRDGGSGLYLWRGAGRDTGSGGPGRARRGNREFATSPPTGVRTGTLPEGLGRTHAEPSRRAPRRGTATEGAPGSARETSTRGPPPARAPGDRVATGTWAAKAGWFDLVTFELDVSFATRVTHLLRLRAGETPRVDPRRGKEPLRSGYSRQSYPGDSGFGSGLRFAPKPSKARDA